MTIFAQIYDSSTLETAWSRVRANRGVPGIDRISWTDFEKNLSHNLHTLQKQIREESYRPMPVVAVRNPKGPAKGPGRMIGISTVRDKIVQQAIAISMGPLFEKNFLPCSFAYRPKKSALDAVKKAASMIQGKNMWALQMDVTNFFDTMEHSLLLDLIGRVIDEKPLTRLISKLLKTKIFKEMGLFDTTMGSQQGSGLSPLLSNIYMHPVDLFLWGRYKDRYLRYSDDLCLFSPEREHLEAARKIIVRCLKEMKLSVNDAKTRLTHLSDGIVYLGYHMDTGGKGPASKSVQGLQSRLAQFDRVRKSDDIEEKLKEIGTVIRGWYNYYKTVKPVDPPNICSLIALVQLAKEMKELRLARDLLKKSASFNYTHPRICFCLAELFSALGMENQAMREYARALEQDPNMEAAKARVRQVQEGEADVHRAIEKIQLVLHHNPDYREGYEKLARYYVELGLYGFAQQAHKKALEIDAESTPESAAPPESPEETGAFDYRRVDQELFLSIFSGRKAAHAKQWVDGRGRWGFHRIDRPLKKKDVHKHLSGEETLGVYPVTEDDHLRFIVFDVDTAKRKILESTSEAVAEFRRRSHKDVLRIKTVCEQMGLTLYIEDSGYKGRHGWLFFEKPVTAKKALSLGQEIIKAAGGPAADMIWELFPMGKSDRHKSIIKLPLGINRKNNRRCLFLDDGDILIRDQALLLKTLKRNNMDAIRWPESEDAPEEAVDETGEIQAVPGLRKMVEKCRVVRHLVQKAKDTNYLNHYERLCLLYTLSFGGQEGCGYLHRVIAYCINYNRDYTQRQIDRRKESPISCAKISEYFPELAQSLPCDCKFNLPPRGYPSPVLYFLESELEMSRPERFEPEAEAPVRAGERTNAGKPAAHEEEDVVEEKKESRILDFERLFSDEFKSEIQRGEMGSDLPNGDVLEGAEEADADEPDFFDLPEEKGAEAVRSPGPLFDFGALEAEAVGEKGPDAPDIGELIREWIRLKRSHAAIERELKGISMQLERIFEASGAAEIETELGTFRLEVDRNERSGRRLVIQLRSI